MIVTNCSGTEGKFTSLPIPPWVSSFRLIEAVVPGGFNFDYNNEFIYLEIK